MGVRVREKKKRSGEWWIFINHKTKRGSKKIGDKKIALAMAKKIEAGLILGDMGFLSKKEKQESEVSSFEEYAADWINDTVPATCKKSTKSDYCSILDTHILPAYGKKQIIEINRMVIKKF